MPILNRDEIVRKLAATEQEAVKEAVKRVNQCLETALDFPIVIKADVVGKLSKVRFEVIRQMQQAGWTVTIHDEGTRIEAR